MERQLRLFGALWLTAGLLVIAVVGDLMYRIALDPQGGWDLAALIPYVFLAPSVLIAIAGWGLVTLRRVGLGTLSVLAVVMMVLGLFALATFLRVLGLAFVMFGLATPAVLMSRQVRQRLASLNPGRMPLAFGVGFLATLVVLMTWTGLVNSRSEQYRRELYAPPLAAHLPVLGAVRISGGTYARPDATQDRRGLFEVEDPVYAVLRPEFESPQEHATRYEWRWKAPSGEVHRVSGRWATTKNSPEGLRVELKVLPLSPETKVRKTIGDWTVEFLIEGVSVRTLKFAVQNPHRLVLPAGIAVDSKGRIYVVNLLRSEIVRLNTMAGAGWVNFKGIRGDIDLDLPSGIFIDAKDRIYIADSMNGRIIRMNDLEGTGWVTFPKRNEKELFGDPGSPRGIAVDSSGRILVADTHNNRIVRVNDMDGTGLTVFGVDGPGIHQFSFPEGIAVDRKGRIYVADTFNDRIVRMDDLTGAGWTVLGEKGSGVNQFEQPEGVWVDGAGRIYIADSNNHRIVRIDDMSGAGWVALGSDGTGAKQFSDPTGIFVDRAGRIYVTDHAARSRLVRMDNMHGAGWVILSSVP